MNYFLAIFFFEVFSTGNFAKNIRTKSKTIRPKPIPILTLDAKSVRSIIYSKISSITTAKTILTIAKNKVTVNTVWSGIVNKSKNKLADKFVKIEDVTFN